MDFVTIFLNSIMMLLAFGEQIPNGEYWNSKDMEWVYSRPTKIHEHSDILEAHEGEKVILPCNFDNLGTKKVVWRRKNELSPLTIGETVFANDSRFSVKKKKAFPKQWPLTIKKVNLGDNGTYECQISSKDKSLRTEVTLLVRKGPNSTRKKRKHGITLTGDVAIERKRTLNLSCNATAREINYANGDLDWFHDSEKLETSADKNIEIWKHFNLTQQTIESRLKIKRVDTKHSGTYICRTSWDFKATRVYVLNAETKNRKRGTEKNVGVEILMPSRKRNEGLNGYDDSKNKATSPLYQTTGNTILTMCLLQLVVYKLTAPNLFT